jgi:phosphatidylglycerol:prolipoprotein diacylglycerol transferase
VWGIFVALGFLFGAFMAARCAKKQGENSAMIWDCIVYLVLAGMIGGRIGHVLWYDPAYYIGHPLEVFEIWRGGLSWFGGFIASAVVGILFLRKKNVDVWRYADIIAFGLPFGKWIGRIGCFLIHDHPGTATDFFLGVQYPDGVTRHDLGLYLSMNAFVLALVMLWLSRKERPTGTYLAVFSLWYGVTRFFFDFLRVVDVRYVGFTPGQYFSVGLAVFGLCILVWIRKRQRSV